MLTAIKLPKSRDFISIVIIIMCKNNRQNDPKKKKNIWTGVSDPGLYAIDVFWFFYGNLVYVNDNGFNRINDNAGVGRRGGLSTTTIFSEIVAYPY